MRPGVQVAGSAIDRVFTQPMVPARRFRGAIDTVLTLALGSVCALGLTLGPVPMNTVALSAPSTSSAGGAFNPESAAVLVPGDVDSADSGSEASDDSSRPRLPASSGRAAPAPVTSPPETSAPANPNAEPGNNQHPQGNQHPPQSQKSQHPSPAHPHDNGTAPQFKAQSTAVKVVETYRIASGLGAFVAEGKCAQPVVHSVVMVTPSVALPPGLAAKSLAPDPAFATAVDGPGTVAVTIFRCQ